MKDKEAIVVLQDMLKKYPRTSKEASAIRLAVGVLAWTSLVESNIKAMGKRARERHAKDIGDSKK